MVSEGSNLDDRVREQNSEPNWSMDPHYVCNIPPHNQQPYIPPRRTKDYWPKHIPADGKR